MFQICTEDACKSQSMLNIGRNSKNTNKIKNSIAFYVKWILAIDECFALNF